MSYKECTQIFRCKDCGMIICENKSSNSNLLKIILIGILTLGISEIVRAVYHKITRHCPCVIVKI